MDSAKRHRRIYTLLAQSFVMRAVLRLKFNYSCQEAPEVPGTYIVLANHNTDWDPLLVGNAFRRHMYFVASEHIFRKGFASRLLRYFLDPISRIKGGNAASTVLEVVRRLRKGHNICIFAEGNRSFNGVTNPILPSTAKLVKSSGMHLVTFKLEGGYFSQPRWGFTFRRGQMRGSVVAVYSPEQLKAMSAPELSRKIEADLFENAYARQAQSPVEFKGRRLAEGLEHALYICPECGGIGTLFGRGNEFLCSCGLHVAYLPTGFLQGGRFKTVAEWDEWQAQELERLAATLGENPAFSDEGIRLVTMNEQHQARQVACGMLSMFKDRLCVGEASIPLASITAFDMHGRATAQFSTGTVHYELQRERTWCGRKYMQLFRAIQGC